MEKKSKIYVAGHQGLVGSSIHRGLEAKGYGNLVVVPHTELDLRRQSDVETFFKKEKPEYVFLAAAKVGGIVANNTYKAEFIYDNIMIAINIIEAAYKNGVRKLLNLGSSCIYPKLAPQPLTEDHLLSGPLEPTNEAYAVAKISAIKLCRYYNEQYGTNFISVMPTNLYGINDNFNLETAHVLPALIRKFHLARLLREGNYDMIRRDLSRHRLGFGLDEKIDPQSRESVDSALRGLGITGEYVLLWGTGEPFREFLFVDDLADACIFLMEKYDYKEIGEFINIGSGIDLKIKDMAMIVRKIVGFGGEIRHDTTKPDGTPRKLMDNSKITALGWKQKIGFEDGIKREYEWYLQ
ncbi:MAG: GDP-L-fucose synthase [Spirochaetes bacterium]|jgi:GDP-L-fucose synthase|nr:GDP-L-fucose synthase [Spirochaetota bacterium]